MYVVLKNWELWQAKILPNEEMGVSGYIFEIDKSLNNKRKFNVVALVWPQDKVFLLKPLSETLSRVVLEHVYLESTIYTDEWKWV